MKEQDAVLNGIDIHYVTWNDDLTYDRPPVLLVHGLTSNSHAWIRLGDFLAAKGLYVIAPDLRGRGLSDKPPHGYGIPFHANDLLSLCDFLGLSKIIFVGHSLGAATARDDAGYRSFAEQIGAGLSID
jgi:pimeloyl-ACP methyl ester carboxylesterase